MSARPAGRLVTLAKSIAKLAEIPRAQRRFRVDKELGSTVSAVRQRVAERWNICSTDYELLVPDPLAGGAWSPVDNDDDIEQAEHIRVGRRCAPSNIVSVTQDWVDLPITMLTFYTFGTVASPQSLREELLAKLGAMELPVLGTALIAPEGINAQFAVPSRCMEEFEGILRSTADPLLHSVRLNIDEEEHRFTLDSLPFEKLVLKVKKQVLSDGLDFQVGKLEH